MSFEAGGVEGNSIGAAGTTGDLLRTCVEQLAGRFETSD